MNIGNFVKTHTVSWARPLIAVRKFTVERTKDGFPVSFGPIYHFHRGRNRRYVLGKEYVDRGINAATYTYDTHNRRGFYAMRHLSSAARFEGMPSRGGRYAVITMWGRVDEHTRGYRTEHMRILVHFATFRAANLVRDSIVRRRMSK